MPRYVVASIDGEDTFFAVNDSEAVQVAYQRIARWIDPGAIEKTHWITAMLHRREDDGELTFVEMIVRPVQPIWIGFCPDADLAVQHEWVDNRTLHRLVGGLHENPGVYGHGAGVRIVDVCRLCGTAIVKDTYCRCDGGAPHTCYYVEPRKFAGELDNIPAS